MSGEAVDKVSLSKWPFGKAVGLSLVLSVLHAVLQTGWTALRYRTYGPRPLAAQAFIVIEGVILMVIFTMGMTHISNQESSEPKGRYYIGIAVVVVAWVVAAFIV